MLKYFLFYTCMLCVLICQAQKETNVWYFGTHAGVDFNSGSPVALIDGEIDTPEGCASICDKDGNLLFYSDGSKVWDRQHNVMPNGSGLMGQRSSVNSGFIVPIPDDATKYYLFTTPQAGGPDGLRYSIIDITLNGGMGDVTHEKNILLESPVMECLSAVKHANGKDIWLVAHGFANGTFYSYLITSSGISAEPVATKIGKQVNWYDSSNAICFSKISPDGTKLAYYFRSDPYFDLFEFNSSTGEIFNNIRIPGINVNRVGLMGMEFSPNSRYLYLSDVIDALYQYDVSSYDVNTIENSRVSLSTEKDINALQLGPDGKIYAAIVFREFLGCINEPNKKGTLSNFVYNAVDLNGKESYSGLPPFIQSYFKISTFDFENLCFGDTTLFRMNDDVDSVIWDFDDPDSGINNSSTDLNPYHVFSKSGTYQVKVTAFRGNESDVHEELVTIHKVPVATKPQDVLICDDDNDGFYNFDLTKLNDNILNGLDENSFDVAYFASFLDYDNNLPIKNASSYTNLLAFGSETIVASVRNRKNKSCSDVIDFKIKIFESPNPNESISKLLICDNTSAGSDDDGVILFDLTQKEMEILNGHNAEDFEVNYYKDFNYRDKIQAPVNYKNTNIQETIYVEIINKNNPECKAKVNFDIKVLKLPSVMQHITIKQCDDDLDGFSIFNLSEIKSELSANYQNENITFYNSKMEAESGENKILNESHYGNKNVSSDIIWTRIENSMGCFKVSKIELVVSTTQIPKSFRKYFYVCDDGTDSSGGVGTFNFSTVTADIEALFPQGQNLNISYYRNQKDALLKINSIVDISNYQNLDSPNHQDIFIRVDHALNNNCLGLGAHISLVVEPSPIAYGVTISDQCDDDGDNMFGFDTSSIEETILNGQKNMDVTYYNESGIELSSPLPNPFLTGTSKITARVTNKNSKVENDGCFDETEIVFNVDEAVIAFKPSDIIGCDDDNDGKVYFDTSNIESSVLGGQTGKTVIYKNEAGHLLPSPLPNPFLTSSQNITVRVENPISKACYDETQLKFVVIEQPALSMKDTWLICEGDAVDIFADTGFDEYLWSTGETTSSILVFEPGNYQVTAANVYEGVRCETIKDITVKNSNIAVIDNIETQDWTQNNNVISIYVNGQGDYEYSLDGRSYQDDNTFRNLKIGDYTVYVRDKNGCGVVNQEVFLMFYPKYFTPNRDGFNDTWHIYNSDLEPKLDIKIYDRYGKLLKILTSSSLGWDGTWNGTNMPTSDYWFVITRQNGKQFKGHFALKR